MRINVVSNAKRNIVWGFTYKAIMLLLPFAARTTILKILGDQYLGLNSLFSSILQILNLADLGFGTAIVYSMYKPIAEDDSETICALLSLYKKIYRFVGALILVCGLALIPFLRYLIKGEVPDNVDIRIVYLVYLINTVLSYWIFAYKASLLSAHQRDDISSRVNSAIVAIQYAVQIALLFLTRNYYVYLMILPIMTLVKNISIAIAVDKKFPKYRPYGTISTDNKKALKKQVGGLFISKVCGTTRNAVDSIFLSMFVGLTTVAIFGNYYYLLNSVHQFIGIINLSLLGGIGNRIASESEQSNHVNFRFILFFYSWIIGWCACCLICLYQHFMIIWVGESLLFPMPAVILFCIYFYAMGATDVKNIYTDATGLWWENKTRSILETIVNFIGNLVLGYLFGVYGIISVTLITIIFINNVMGSHILFKHYFKNESLFQYFAEQILYFSVCVVACCITFFACSFLPSSGYLGLIEKMFLCVILPNLVYVAAFSRTEHFKRCTSLVKNNILKKLSK